MARDIHIYESGNGGEMRLKNNDIILSNSIYQTIYISLFGGNVNETDWWGNNLFNSKKFNSETEKTLTRTALNSSSRFEIENAVKQDLKEVSKLIDAEINVKILSKNSVKITIFISSSNDNISIVWNSAKDEVIIDKLIWAKTLYQRLKSKYKTI